MKIGDLFDHRNALEIIAQKQNVWEEINLLLNDQLLSFGYDRPNIIKDKVASGFSRFGWADRVRVNTNSLLTVNFVKNRVGVCLQLGNVARSYADLLKLAVLGKRNIVDAGVMIVPDKVASKKLGANYASFERIANEMQDYAEIIELPLIILALSD